VGVTLGPKTCKNIGGVKCTMVWYKGPKNNLSQRGDGNSGAPEGPLERCTDIDTDPTLFEALVHCHEQQQLHEQRDCLPFWHSVVLKQDMTYPNILNRSAWQQLP